MLMRDACQPFRTAAPRGSYHIMGGNILRITVFIRQARASHNTVLVDDGIGMRTLQEGKSANLPQMVIHSLKHFIGILCAHMAHRATHEVNIVFAALICNLIGFFIIEAKHLFRRAEIEIH